MNKKVHASLLAKKIFASNNFDEVNAFICLDLDVDWLSEYSLDTVLVERAFRVIQDQDLFEKWWASVQRQHPNLDVWSELPNNQQLSEIFLQAAGSFAFKTQLLADSPGSEKQLKDLSTRNKSIESALRPTWKNVTAFLKEQNVLSSVVEDLDKYRDQNLYLTATKEKDFNALRPTVLTASNAMDMYIRLNTVGVNAKNLWYLHAFMEAQWDKWDDEQWKIALKNQRNGFWVQAVETAAKVYCPYGSYTSNQRAKFEELTGLVEKFYKKIPALGSLTEDLAKKDVLILSKTGFARISDEALRSCSRILGRGIQGLIEKSIASNPSPNMFSLGIASALVDTTCFKTTMLSTQSLKLLSQAELPTTVEQMCQWIENDFSKDSTSLKMKTPYNLPMLTAHLGAALTGQAQKTFLDSLQDSTLYRNESSQMVLGLLNWSMKGMETARNANEKSNWANMYWQSIFNAPMANQHYWLKKIHGIQDFIVPVECWNTDLEETLMKVLGKRKSNDAIQSVLSKMSLVNATASLGLEEPTKRRSKL